MQVAICEDIKQDARLLIDMLEVYQKKEQLDLEIQVFENAEALLDVFESGRFQILLMDVFMDKLTGVDAVRKIREQDEECAVIFITTSENHAVEGFALRATHYLVKPINYESFSKAMSCCKEQIDQFARCIEMKSNRETVKVRLRDIHYAEVFKHNCVIHTSKGDVTTYMTIDALEAALRGFPFFRCHRSYLVNLRWVRNMTETDFILPEGGVARIGRTYSSAAKKAYRRFIIDITEKTGVF